MAFYVNDNSAGSHVDYALYPRTHAGHYELAGSNSKHEHSFSCKRKTRQFRAGHSFCSFGRITFEVGLFCLLNLGWCDNDMRVVVVTFGSFLFLST